MPVISNNDKHISYNILKSQKKKATYVIFHHGLMSNKESSKALKLRNYCQKMGYNFISFDNYGHGESSGEFTEQTISSWLDGAIQILQLADDAPVIFVGSSMGGWIAMLASIMKPEVIKGTILISPAPDFTENLIWNNMNKQQQEALQKLGVIHFKGNNPECDYTYPISHELIKDARQHLLMQDKQIKIPQETHIIHGMMDEDVPHEISLQIAKKIVHDNVVVKLAKSGTHKMSRMEDMQLVFDSVESLVKKSLTSC